VLIGFPPDPVARPARRAQDSLPRIVDGQHGGALIWINGPVRRQSLPRHAASAGDDGEVLAVTAQGVATSALATYC